MRVGKDEGLWRRQPFSWIGWLLTAAILGEPKEERRRRKTRSGLVVVYKVQSQSGIPMDWTDFVALDKQVQSFQISPP